MNLPTSCLLGCVDVADVLPQEEYRDTYPKGESASPYVFVCTNPQELLVKFPMQGQHKICKKVRVNFTYHKYKCMQFTFRILSIEQEIYFHFQTKWIPTFIMRQRNLPRSQKYDEN